MNNAYSQTFGIDVKQSETYQVDPKNLLSQIGLLKVANGMIRDRPKDVIDSLSSARILVLDIDHDDVYDTTNYLVCCVQFEPLTDEQCNKRQVPEYELRLDSVSEEISISRM